MKKASLPVGVGNEALLNGEVATDRERPVALQLTPSTAPILNSCLLLEQIANWVLLLDQLFFSTD